jgi:hypothetical protein
MKDGGIFMHFQKRKGQGSSSAAQGPALLVLVLRAALSSQWWQ